MSHVNYSSIKLGGECKRPLGIIWRHRLPHGCHKVEMPNKIPAWLHTFLLITLDLVMFQQDNWLIDWLIFHIVIEGQLQFRHWHRAGILSNFIQREGITLCITQLSSENSRGNQTRCSDSDLLGLEELGDKNRHVRAKEKGSPKGYNCLTVGLKIYNHSIYANIYIRYKQEHKDG